MAVHDESDPIEWQDGVPVSRRYGDPYFSRADGLAETRHVFLGGNDLARRFRDCDAFSVAELGFGTGLSFLATWQLWLECARPGAVLSYMSVEAAPLGAADMSRALSAWPELAPQTAALLARWPYRPRCLDLGTVRLTLLVGDVGAVLPTWPGCADCWFLDGFAPSRNPAMWAPGVLRAVAAKSAQGASVATYSAAGAVRRGLTAQGFHVEKRPGFGRKREMSVGWLPAD